MSSRRKPSSSVPIVRIVFADVLELDPADLGQILQEINNRQWAAVTEVLIEAKTKAESMLRNDQVFDSPGRAAYYQGWVAYADYVLGSLEGLRTRAKESAAEAMRQPEPGPE